MISTGYGRPEKDGCPRAGRRSGPKSVNLARVRGSGRPEKVGRPVVPGAPDVRKASVVRGSGSTRDASFGTRFWAEFGDFGVKLMRFRG